MGDPPGVTEVSRATAEVSHATAEVPHRGVAKASSGLPARPLERCRH